MIVRISTEGQYEISDGVIDRLNELDNATVAAVEAGDEASFQTTFAALLDMVRSEGKALDGEDLRESELILPPPDITLAEAGEDFTGEGLLPD